MQNGDNGSVISLPRRALVVLAGMAGSGKSSFAEKRFSETQIVSSDRMRALISDDETDQSVSGMAFALMHDLIGKRLAVGRLTIVDSTALSAQTRRELLFIARRSDTPAVLILFDLPVETCVRRDAKRARQVGRGVIERQYPALEETRRRAPREGWSRVYVIDEKNEDKVTVEYDMLPGDQRDQRGPFDIIGDIHGCLPELRELLGTLGYGPDERGVWRHPQGRRFIPLGDLTDRGPDSPGVLRLTIEAVKAGAALFVPGNHDNKLMRYLLGHRVRIGNGLERTIEQLEQLPYDQRQRLIKETIRLISDSPAYLILDGGRLVVAHAGIKEWMIGKMTRRIKDFTLYGDVAGVDETGYPIRRDWAAEYSGRATVAYGHTVVPEPAWINNTVNIDQGCVFGGRLTALRWPEREVVQVQAHAAYAEHGSIDFDAA